MDYLLSFGLMWCSIFVGDYGLKSSWDLEILE